MTGRSFSTHQNQTESLDALHDGVPSWMRGSLDDWLASQLRDGNYSDSLNYADLETVRALERLLRVDLTNGSSHRGSIFEILFSKMNNNTELKLDVVDALLQIGAVTIHSEADLEGILLQSGSKWRIAVGEEPNTYQLQDRVDEAASAVISTAATQENDTSRYLIKAWNNIFGRSPDSSIAYSNAVKAIEAASWKVTIPNDSRATLGKIIGMMRDHPELFSVAVYQIDSNNSIEATWRSMLMVWDGQTDRHGTSNPSAPSQDAAEQAVLIAISLTQQFERGLIKHI